MPGIAESCLAVSAVAAVLVGSTASPPGAEERPRGNVVSVSWEGPGEIQFAPHEKGDVLEQVAAVRLGGKVRAEGPRFTLEADRLMYSAAKGVLILESHSDNAVRLSLTRPDDRRALRIVSRKIMLSIAGKRLALDGASSLILEGKPQGQGNAGTRTAWPTAGPGKPQGQGDAVRECGLTRYAISGEPQSQGDARAQNVPTVPPRTGRENRMGKPESAGPVWQEDREADREPPLPSSSRRSAVCGR